MLIKTVSVCVCLVVLIWLISRSLRRILKILVRFHFRPPVVIVCKLITCLMSDCYKVCTVQLLILHVLCTHSA